MLKYVLSEYIDQAVKVKIIFLVFFLYPKVMNQLRLAMIFQIITVIYITWGAAPSSTL